MSAISEYILEAAGLTFGMLRFEQDAGHALHSPNNSDLGVERYVFLPSWQSTPRADVVSFLAGLPCPALIYPTTTRGVVSLLLLDELSGERKAWAQKMFDNQIASINEIAARLGLVGDTKVLMEIPGEDHIVSLDVLRAWSQRFVAPLGWSLGHSQDNDERAVAQITLIASDGRVSPRRSVVAPWHRPGV